MGQCSIWGTHNDHNQIETDSCCATGASETSEKKVIAVVVSPICPPLSDLPQPSIPFCLWPEVCHSRTCQPDCEFDQFPSFTGEVRSAVKAFPSSPVSRVSISRCGFQAKRSPTLYSVSHHPARQSPSSPHSLYVAKMCSVCTPGSAEKPRESTQWI